MRESTLRTVAATGAAIGLILTAQAAPRAWGFEAHRAITARAIDLLPPELLPFFRRHKAMVVEHSIDPDLWRNAGFLEEPPRHFLDIDAYGPPPFDALPREYDAAVAKFGKEVVHKNGLLPWRLAEMQEKLVGAFRDQGRGRPFALENIKFFAAAVSHYVGDAHVPFHAVVNYDGQLTNQHGIHSRYESELYERYQDKLRVKPTRTSVPGSVRDYAFDTLIESAGLVPEILRADLAAIGNRDVYDDAYFKALFERTRSTMEQRLAKSSAAVAALITRAWIEAGKPPIPAEPAPRPARKRQGAAQKEPSPTVP